MLLVDVENTSVGRGTYLHHKNESSLAFNYNEWVGLLHSEKDPNDRAAQAGDGIDCMKEIKA